MSFPERGDLDPPSMPDGYECRHLDSDVFFETYNNRPSGEGVLTIVCTDCGQEETLRLPREPSLRDQRAIAERNGFFFQDRSK